MFNQNNNIESYINMLIKTKDKCEDKIQKLEKEFSNLPFNYTTIQSSDVLKDILKDVLKKELIVAFSFTFLSAIVALITGTFLTLFAINLITYCTIIHQFKKSKLSYNKIQTLSNFLMVIEQKIEIFSKANNLGVSLKNNFTVEEIFNLEKQYENDINNIYNSNINQIYQVYQVICDEYKKDNIYLEYFERKQESYDKYISTQEKSFLTEEDNTIDEQFDFGFFNNQYDYSVNTENKKIKQKTLKKF